MKKVYFSGFFPRMYSGIKIILDYPPEGYEYVVLDNPIKKNLIRFAMDSKLIKFIYRNFMKLIFNTSGWYSSITKSPIPNDAKLAIACNGNLDLEVPWIAWIVDNPMSLVGYDYNAFINSKDDIERKFMSPLCKKIIIYNESSVNQMKKYFGKDVIKKIALVRPAVQKQDFKKDYNKKEIIITFIGSTGNPDDFYIKGGLEAIETFKRVSKDFDNISLIVRCKVPNEVKEKYREVRNLIILEDALELNEWFDILKKTDICLNPGHMYPLMASLESLSFGAPVIMLDTWGVRDLLTHQKNSLLIKPSKNIKGYNAEDYPLNIREKYFIEDIKNMDERVILDLCNALKSLIKNPKLREKLGKNGKRTAETKFSIETRNKKLKKIFDEITN